MASEVEDDNAMLAKIALDDDQNLSREEALAKVSLILARTENPKLLSDITITEVSLLTALHVVGDMLDFKILDVFGENFEMLRVSKERQGRKELLEIASEIRRQPERMGGLGGLRQRLFRNIQ
jgi:hypothetical protein